jgi:alcohol dehydrogenase class IV
MTLNYYNPLEKVHTFISPGKIIFGVEALKNIGNELEILNQDKIILITDKVIRNTVPVQEFISILLSNKFKVKVFESEIKEPTVDMVNIFVDFVRSEKKGIVIGIGGGSIMDQAKIGSALATNKGEAEDYVGANKIQNDGLPLILIPTTAGTGAEASKNALFMGRRGKSAVSSPKILPTLAVIDPIVTISLPPRPTAFTGMDTLSHAIEGIMSLNCNPMVMASALEVISLVNTNLPIAYINGSNIQARYEMCIAATLGGLCLNAGVVLGHSIAYTLDHFDIPHGLGCAIALPYIIKFNSPVIFHKMKRIAGALGLNDDRINDPVQITSYIVDTIKHLNALFCISLSLQSMAIDKEKIKELADECFSKYPRPNNPREYSKDDIVTLYEQLWSGDLDIS